MKKGHMDNDVKRSNAEEVVIKILTWLERLALFFTLMALSFRLLHWPGSGYLFISSLSWLSFLYFFLWVRPIIEKKPGFNIFLTIVAVGGMSVAYMAILFKIMFWPGAHFMLWMAIFIGLTTLALSALGLIKDNSSYDKPNIKWVLYRQVPIMLIMIVMVSVNQVTYYRTFGSLRDDEKFMELYEDCHTKRINCEQKRAYEDSVYQVKYSSPNQ